MADLSDVLDALVGVLAGALYPDGTDAPSPVGTDVSVFAGWPTPNRLEEALAAGHVLVSVFPPPNLERDRTRMLPQYLRVAPPVHTVTVAVDGSTVTIGGIAAAGQNAGVVFDEASVSHPVQASDTPATIAAALATLIQARGRVASSAGSMLTVPGTHRLVARVGARTALAKEVERTDRGIMVTVWAPSPEARTAAGRLVRTRLAFPKFVGLVDGSAAWIRYDRTNDADTYERAGLYRRDLTYWVEFGQYLVVEADEVILPQTETGPAATDGVPPAPPITTTA